MKKGIILTAILIFSWSCFGFENFKFNLTPEFGFMYGTIHEYVYDPECLNTDHLESRLDWDVKNIPFFELTASADIYKYGYFSVAGKIAVPGSSGFMQDYDWLNSIGGSSGNHYDWMDEDPTELTNYSKHNNKLESYYGVNVSAGGNIYLPYEIKITPFAAYDYEYFLFSSCDGFRKYKSENFIEEPFSGKVISYTQECNSVMLGFRVNGTMFDKLNLSTSFMASPKLSFNNALDYHYVNDDSGGTLFWDKLSYYFLLKSKTTISYIFTENHKAGITFNCQYSPLTKGPDFSIPIDSEGNIKGTKWSKTTAQGGTSSFLWSLALSYTFSY